MSQPDTKLPLLASLFFVIIGLLIGAISGLSSGSIAGGIVAGIGIVPACYAMWAGIQNKESQAPLLYGILAFLTAAGVAGLLILLRLVDWVF